MQRDRRLRATADFQRVHAEGRSWPHRLLILVAAPRQVDGEPTRVGLIASKRVGPAVVRNRVRRRLREAIRARQERIRPGWDLVVIVRRPATDATFAALATAVDVLLARAGLAAAEATCAGSPSA
jgi:ribonuclease P protein component